MRTLSVLVVGGLLFGMVGCGGSNPGSGTKTLFVKAHAETRGSTDSSWMAVEVREGHSEGNLINDAVVTIRGNKTGEYNLGWEGISFGGFRAGAYLRNELAWDTGWHITVKRGDDGLEAYLEAPGLTTITDPIGGTTFRRADGNPMVVRWKDTDGRRAQIVTVDFDKADNADRQFSDFDDPGEVQLEANVLVADKERLELRRRNEVKLEGGTAGSVMSAETKHRIEFVVE